MTGRLPDFAVIGAMKCGTSSLHDQLAAREGFFMSDPKEPNFFSDDSIFERGIEWYRSLFAPARPDQICGESSTHYTKLPTHPHACSRMREHLEAPKLVYVLRDPIDRIVSQYVHEWTENQVREPIDVAVRRHPRYRAYSSYARQLEPYLSAFGREAILLVAFERLVSDSDRELARICGFLGDPSARDARWRRDLPPRNLSRDRLRKSRVRSALLGLGPVQAAKSWLPPGWRERIKARWQMRERPMLSPPVRAELEAALDLDLEVLGGWLRRPLRCSRWRDEVLGESLDW
ncbi:MAG: sulfotransferase [Myxococcota bacterium]